MNATDFAVNTFSYIWDRSFADTADHLADQGYRAFEVLLTAPHLWPSDCDATARRDLVRRLDARGLRVVSLNIGGFDNNLASPGADVRATSVALMGAAIDLAGDLGGADLVLSPGTARALSAPPKTWMVDWFHQAMETLVPRAEARGVRLLIENIPYAFLPDVVGIMDAIDGLPATVGVVYDVANGVYIREDPVAAIERIGDRLHLVHLSDTPLDVWRHAPVGQGVVPFGDIGAALRRVGYAGPNVLEIISDDPDTAIRASAETLVGMDW
jgi:L-ribulose-5-phosphate 3-epimerase